RSRFKKENSGQNDISIRQTLIFIEFSSLRFITAAISLEDGNLPIRMRTHSSDELKQQKYHKERGNKILKKSKYEKKKAIKKSNWKEMIKKDQKEEQEIVKSERRKSYHLTRARVNRRPHRSLHASPCVCVQSDCLSRATRAGIAIGPAL